MTRIAEIRARLEAATPGLWDAPGYGEVWGGDRLLVQTNSQHDDHLDNAILIAHAPADIRYLLDALQEADGLLREALPFLPACAWAGMKLAASSIIAEAVAEEREACAVLAESQALNCDGYNGSVAAEGRDPLDPASHSDAHDYCHRSLEIAAAIRARTTTDPAQGETAPTRKGGR